MDRKHFSSVKARVRLSRATFLLPVKTRGILSFVTGETRFGFLSPSSAQSSICSSLKDTSKALLPSTQPSKRFPQCRKGNPTKSFQWNSCLDFLFCWGVLCLFGWYFCNKQHYAATLVGFCPVFYFAVTDLFVIPATSTDKTPMLCWRWTSC